MTFTFMPADSFTEPVGLFISLIGSPNSGKTFSALRLARGIAGPTGKLAVLDTEGGRTLHLKDEFRFDANVMQAPFRPERFTEAAKAAEDAGYAALVIDSFSMEWAGLGGVLDWQAEELKRLGGSDRQKGASWIAPKMAHKAMVYALLQRRIPIVFSIRGEETFIPPNTKLFKPITNKNFPFEVTVSFRLETERKGFIDLKDPATFKLEGFHRGFFKDGDRISEEHGRLLAEWARGGTRSTGSTANAFLLADGDEHAERGIIPLRAWWQALTPADKKAVGGAEKLAAWKIVAEKADADFAADDVPFDDGPPPDIHAQPGARQAETLTPHANTEEHAR